MPEFADLGVPAPILKALASMGYEAPTPVQAAAIPPLLKGKDALVEAQTGSGKTTAFGVPAVWRGSVGPGLRVVILVPTRELARQVAEEVRALGAGSPFRAVAVTGGVLAEQEERTLGGDVRCVVATPGRLLSLLDAGKLRTDRVELVILDEADRMLDMGFQPDVEKVLAATQARQQTVMVSATLPRDVRDLAARHLKAPAEVRVEAPRVPESLSHFRLNVLDGRKEMATVALMKKEDPQRAILFLHTRTRVVAFTKLLKRAGFAADALQGDMTHDQRRHVFDLFTRGTTKILVATDLASRGLDVPEMELVVNVDVPIGRGDYVHRAGRAARMGKPGKVVTLVLPDEKERRIELEREAGVEFTPYRLTFSEADIPPEPEPQALPKGARRQAKGPPKTPRPPAPPQRAPRAVRKEEERKTTVRKTPPKVDELPPSRKGRRTDKDA
jgi:ATP-dependent RNA helicase RhlE